MPYYFGDIVFLKKTNGSDAGGSSFQAGPGIRKGDSSQRQDWHFLLTGLLQECDAGRLSSGSIFFFEDRGKYRETRPV